MGQKPLSTGCGQEPPVSAPPAIQSSGPGDSTPLLGHYGEKEFSKPPLCAPADLCVVSKHVEVRGQPLGVNPCLSTSFETGSLCQCVPDYLTCSFWGMLQGPPPASWWGLQVLALLHPACIWVPRGLKLGCQAYKAIASPPPPPTPTPEASLQPSILHPSSDGHQDCGGDRVILGPIHSALRSSLLLNSLCGFFFLFLKELGLESRALCILSKHSTTGQQLSMAGSESDLVTKHRHPCL